jgi:hypothetical protein
MNASQIVQRGQATSALQPMLRCLAGLLFAQALAGCGGGEGSASAPPTAKVLPTPAIAPAVPAVAPAAWQGHFIGTVSMDAGQYYGDALLTVDGVVRLYVGGPYASDGTVQKTRFDGATQFVGKVQGNDNGRLEAAF